ncbi:ATP-binding cassette domain-containing protein, partial [Methanosphaera stadtmanae]
MSNKVIEVKNLNTYFDDHNVLKNINTDIEKNSVTALIGPSGCGKST